LLAKAVKITEEQREREDAKHEEFLKKRRAHYNEFRVLKGSENSDSEHDFR
jgi:hypothetical protein